MRIKSAKQLLRMAGKMSFAREIIQSRIASERTMRRLALPSKRDPKMQEAIDAVLARPCQCVSCGECRGSGSVWYSMGGAGRGTYLGHHRWDDLDEIETCDVCGGHGIVEMCDRCGELEGLEQMEQEEDERQFRLERMP